MKVQELAGLAPQEGLARSLRVIKGWLGKGSAHVGSEGRDCGYGSVKDAAVNNSIDDMGSGWCAK